MSLPESRARRAGLAQPALGLAGLLFVLLAVLTLGLFPSRPQALTTTITIITFGLPFLIAMTLWWQGWPFRRFSRATNGWGRFFVLIALTLVFAAIGQLVTGQFDIAGIFGVDGGFPLFPYGFVLAASIFVTMLQITFVCEKMPLHTVHPIVGGISAVVLSWLIGLAQYFLLLHWDEGPGAPPVPPVAGIGPIAALDWPAVLLSIVVLQMVFFVSLKGYPFSRISSRVVRFTVVNAFTIGGGVALYSLLRTVGLSGDTISAIAASITGAVIVIEILFQGWPADRLTGAAARAVSVVAALVLAAIIYGLLLGVGGIGYPSGPGVPPLSLWIAGVGLNIIATFAIVHAAVFEHWPFRPADAPAATADLDAPASVEPAESH